jgi:hypothetical protein
MIGNINVVGCDSVIQYPFIHPFFLQGQGMYFQHQPTPFVYFQPVLSEPTPSINNAFSLNSMENKEKEILATSEIE